MDTIGKRIRAARGVKNQEEIARAIGITSRTYSSYENDEAVPRVDVLMKMADLFGLSTDFILKGEGITNDFSMIPFYIQPASAGEGVLVEDQAIGKFLAFRTDWLRNEMGAHIRNLFVMRVSGDSMESPSGEHGRRQLRDRDLILVNQQHTNLLPNQIYVISVGDELYVKAYRRNVHPDVVEFYSFNPAYTPLVFDAKNRKLLKVVGRVCWVGRTIV